ncbi:hypothetical protein KL928_000793 [Ogataea angusta]|uniref:FAD dependent oxidoreductase domain-containing protein n=1 Tax=Pichia angusta TaxID=870730 RepID=A0AAN6DM88_PICAN|nr:uncharacterized protein KL928_000793 [Ogataea angusta]KAG7822318.1 hypothetical protein KL928_000793 [Ogataea angusta]
MDYSARKQKAFPSKETTLSYWIGEAEAKLAKHRTTEELPEQSDVLIIGSGLSGASVAFNLLEQTDEKVLLLEARDVCSGATGRNGGHMRSYYHHDQYEFSKNYGQKVAAHIAIKEHENTSFGVYTPTSSVWPYKLVCGLLEIALSKGLNLQTNTAVEELECLEDNTWLAKTPRGHVHAKKVVIATNAYTRALLPDFWGKITPVKGVVSHLQTESNKTLETNMVHTIPVEIDYISVQDDGSLIVGGGGQTYKTSPNREMMVDNADDSYFPEETRQHFSEQVWQTLDLSTTTRGLGVWASQKTGFLLLVT